MSLASIVRQLLPEKRAYFVVQESDFKPPILPLRFAKYSTLIVNPAIGETRFRQLHAALPGHRLLAYINAMDVPFWRNGQPAASQYVRDMEALWPDWWNLHAPDGSHIKIFTTPAPLNHYIATFSTDRFWATWAALHFKPLLYDGVYIDNHFQATPVWIIRKYAEAGFSTSDALQRAYEYERANGGISAAIRAEWPDAIVVSNCGTGRVDEAVNGISLEDGYSPLAYQVAHLIGNRSPLSIAWCDTQEKLDAVRALRASGKLDRVQIGFIGGSGVTP